MADVLARLEQTIHARRGSDPNASYVAALQAGGPARIAKKLGEEAVETIIAGLGDDAAALVGEAADLLFHLLVLLDAREVPLDRVLSELARREGLSGLDEKAGRSA